MKTRNKKRKDYDFNLSPADDHFMFWEYLQAGTRKQELYFQFKYDYLKLQSRPYI